MGAVAPTVVGLEPLPGGRSGRGPAGQARIDDDLELRVRDRAGRCGSICGADSVDDPQPLLVEFDLGRPAPAFGLDQGHAHFDVLPRKA